LQSTTLVFVLQCEPPSVSEKKKEKKKKEESKASPQMPNENQSAHKEESRQESPSNPLKVT
jgi:hypothetical protein